MINDIREASCHNYSVQRYPTGLRIQLGEWPDFRAMWIGLVSTIRYPPLNTAALLVPPPRSANPSSNLQRFSTFDSCSVTAWCVQPTCWLVSRGSYSTPGNTWRPLWSAPLYPCLSVMLGSGLIFTTNHRFGWTDRWSVAESVHGTPFWKFLHVVSGKREWYTDLSKFVKCWRFVSPAMWHFVQMINYLKFLSNQNEKEIR